ncbi:hypothetical protein PCE1_001941 [Barthelona sp. PCE]
MQKRRNNGRAKKNRGRTPIVRCDNCGRCVAKDKSIRRSVQRNMIDASSKKDVEAASVYTNYKIPRTYHKLHYCISCACHHRLVRVRSREDRRVRTNPRARR